MAASNVIAFPVRRREAQELTRPDLYHAWKFKRCQREGIEYPDEEGVGLCEWEEYKQRHLRGDNAELMREVFAEIERKYG